MAKIYIETYGCSANFNNGEIIAGLLSKAGHDIIREERLADIIILNTCIVKGKTETKMRKRIRQIKKPLIIAGCMPEVIQDLPFALVGVHHTKEITEVVNNLLKGKVTKKVGKRDEIKLCQPKIRKNKIINIIQISEGCKGICSYCIVRYAKGKLFSYPDKKIIEEIKPALADGCKEIWVTSQDCAAYENNLAKLLEKICAIQGDFLVRIGMSNPDNIAKILDNLIKAYKNPKIFKFLHIPVQSGNERILKLMNRKYNVNEFKEIIKKFRKTIPEITISTDIICGFPTETRQEFEDSINLIKEIKPDVLNISRFWPRPGTQAAEMKGQIHGNETKERSKELTKVFNKISLERNKVWTGWQGSVLIDEKGKKPGTWIARNFAYKPVILKGNFKLGQKVNIKIAEVTGYDLRSGHFK